MNMKNAARFWGIIALVAVIGFTMAACEQPTDDPAHEHQWGAWSTVTAATCTTPGSETRSCSLDATHTDTRDIAIDPNAHNYQTYAQTTAPTCLVDGEEQAVCTRDNTHTKGTRPITALGHDYQNYTETTAPTCTIAGIETGTCTRDQVTSTRPINALGHDYRNYSQTNAPTCTTVGKEEAPCTRDSSHEKGIRDIAINPNAHQWKNTYNVTTPATCSATGIETDTCNLNAAHTRTQIVVINPNAHNWNTDTGLCNNNCRELYYELGDTGPGGGKIFYRTATGFTMTDNNTTAHYLEAAPDDMGSDSTMWASSAYISPSDGGTGEYINIYDTETAIGTGRKNTALILAKDSDAPPAKACNEYELNGVNDWFLPSFDELDQLYENRDYVNNFQSFWYWSSSEGGLDSAGIIGFHSGGKHPYFTKYSSGYARAVRAF